MCTFKIKMAIKQVIKNSRIGRWIVHILPLEHIFLAKKMDLFRFQPAIKLDKSFFISLSVRTTTHIFSLFDICDNNVCVSFHEAFTTRLLKSWGWTLDVRVHGGCQDWACHICKRLHSRREKERKMRDERLHFPAAPPECGSLLLFFGSHVLMMQTVDVPRNLPPGRRAAGGVETRTQTARSFSCGVSCKGSLQWKHDEQRANAA